MLFVVTCATTFIGCVAFCANYRNAAVGYRQFALNTW